MKGENKMNWKKRGMPWTTDEWEGALRELLACNANISWGTDRRVSVDKEHPRLKEIRQACKRIGIKARAILFGTGPTFGGGCIIVADWNGRRGAIWTCPGFALRGVSK